MKAKSIQGKSPEEIRKAIKETIAKNFKPTLGIVFLSISQDRDEIASILDEVGIKIYGATTNGEFTNEGIGEKSTAILLLDINPEYFQLFFEEYLENNPREVAKGIAVQAKKVFPNAAFLIAGSHMETDAEQLLFGFEDIFGKEVNVYGGMAGDDFTFKEQFVFTNGKSSNRGIVALALDAEKILIKGKATCGWKPMGTEKIVTKSEGNRLYTIDGVTALEMTKKYSGIENLNKENEKVVMEIATMFPMQLQREKGNPVMRPGLVVNWDDGSFYTSGTVPQGSKVRFSLPPDFDVIDKVIEEAKELKEKEMPEPDAVIVFSCAGRLMTFGPLISKEIDGINDVWKVPMVGMFSNAELARATGGNLEMHNLTCCNVVLKEK